MSKLVEIRKGKGKTTARIVAPLAVGAAIGEGGGRYAGRKRFERGDGPPRRAFGAFATKGGKSDDAWWNTSSQERGYNKAKRGAKIKKMSTPAAPKAPSLPKPPQPPKVPMPALQAPKMPTPVAKSRGVGRKAASTQDGINAMHLAARTPSGKYVSHVNDLQVFHVRPRAQGPSPKLTKVTKADDWIGRENDGVKLMDPQVEIPSANKVGRRIPKSVETVEKGLTTAGERLATRAMFGRDSARVTTRAGDKLRATNQTGVERFAQRRLLGSPEESGRLLQTKRGAARRAKYGDVGKGFQ